MKDNNPLLFNRDLEIHKIIDIMQRIKSGITSQGGRTLSFVPFSSHEMFDANNPSDAINHLCGKGLIKKCINSSGIAGVAVEVIDESAFENFYNLITKKDKDFWFDDNTFVLRVLGGSTKTINLSTTNVQGSDPYYLMSGLVEVLRKKGLKKDGWLIAKITKEDIKKEVGNRMKMPISDSWLKNTKANLKKNIPNNCKGYIDISNFERKLGYYVFKLKLPE